VTIQSNVIVVGDEPVKIVTGNGTGTALINTDQDLVVGPESDQEFTVLANAADPGYHTFTVGQTETLWAKLAGATADANVQVLSFGH
jgi:hypothetical protein